ncbi:hypothetical protein DPMN_122413 [Dreissena polymorpha]|uniref:Uncharacterized protein n=1 Tax=Dreissena polymorpha TaxID=45954 RepID=A0A9D4GSF4_DREPO|nr:hypothetical protein DPMN_122413 [Dreissena polymorpha]
MADAGRRKDTTRRDELAMTIPQVPIKLRYPSRRNPASKPEQARPHTRPRPDPSTAQTIETSDPTFTLSLPVTKGRPLLHIPVRSEFQPTVSQTSRPRNKQDNVTQAPLSY